MPVATLTNPSPAAGDQFGSSVAISGTRVVVAAVGDDSLANNAGSAYVYDLASATPTVPVTTLTNPSPAAADQFGSSVGISGMRVVVGAFQDDTGVENAGSVYVYDLASATPALPVTTLANPSPAAGDWFGWSVAITGTRVVVGAYQDDSGESDAGSVYIYDIASATPTVPVITLTNPSPEYLDHFGSAVGISGVLVVVGTGLDDTGASDAGIAYVFDLTSAMPSVPVITLNNPSPEENEYFGSSVGISGTRVAVGAYLDGTAGLNAGSVYLYNLAGATPAVPVATLIHSTPAAGNQFGSSVAISGTRVLIAAPLDDTGQEDQGSVYVYNLASTTPGVPILTLNNPDPQLFSSFGWSVAISGTRAVVGSPRAVWVWDANYFVGSAYVFDIARTTPTVPWVTLDHPSPDQADDWFGSAVAVSGMRAVVGACGTERVYVYNLASATPGTAAATLTNPTPAAGDGFGWSVAIFGTRVVVGAVGDDAGATNAGSAYVYDLASATPTVPVSTLNNPNPTGHDRFGHSVAIAGTRVVVGAPGDDTGAQDAGVVRIYDLTSGTPTVAMITLTNPTPAVNDQFGYSVAISSTRVVVGALFDDTEAQDAGSAYVYELASTTPAMAVATLNKSSPALKDFFGSSVAVDSTTVVIGVPADDMNAADRGAVYVFGRRPTLRITPGAPGSATISWTPNDVPGFVLQHSPALSPANWIDAPSGATNPVTVPVGGMRFHRLIKKN